MENIGYFNDSVRWNFKIALTILVFSVYFTVLVSIARNLWLFLFLNEIYWGDTGE